MKTRILSITLLAIYALVLIQVMIFKDVPLIRLGSMAINFGGTQTGPANLIPFKTMRVYWHVGIGSMIGAINLLGNIILLVPIGFLIPVAFRFITWKRKVLVGILIGFAIEGTQVIMRIGIFDIDDVILNALGVVVGYAAFRSVTKLLPTRESQMVAITISLVIALIGCSAFYIIGVQKYGKFPLSFESRPANAFSRHLQNGVAQSSPAADPCNGTNGTGKILDLVDHRMTIKLRNGVHQVIVLTSQTTIRNARGSIGVSALKAGDQVTLVLQPDKSGKDVAMLVLVCGTGGEKERSASGR